MKDNQDKSGTPVSLTAVGFHGADEARASLERRGNIIWLEVTDGRGQKLKFSIGLSLLLAKLTRHGGDVFSTQERAEQ